MKLDFSNPVEISTQIDPNQVEINVNDKSLFRRASDGAMIEIDTEIEAREITGQVDQELDEVFEAFGAAVGTGGKALIVITFFIRFLLKFAMNHILGHVRSLSLITHLFMMQISFPVIALTFFSYVFEFVTFDLIPTDLIYPYIFDFSGDKPYSAQAEAIGYESRYIVWNLGSLFLYIILILLG